MKKFIWLLIVIIIILVIYFATSGKTPAKGFNVGLISILSGDYAAVGENFKNGVVLANEQYNAAHPDAQIKVSIEDDGFSGGKGMSAYQKLLNVDKIDALINVSTPTIDSIYDSVTKLGMPVIQGGEQGREPTDDNVIGIYPDSITSEYDYGVYMRNKGITQMNLVYTNLDAMVRFVESFKKGFQGSTTDFKIDATEKDFRTHALKAAAGNPQAVGLFIYPQQGAQFIKEYLKIVKTKPALFFDTSFVSGFTDYQRLLGDLSVLDGAVVGGMRLESTEPFKAAYKARFNADAGFLADIGYDAFNMLVQAHADDAGTWVKNIKQSSFPGASGTIKFGPTGNRLPDTKMMVMQGGKMVDVK
jgi:ABC-type branched-subunit amino acid transport system substrate-binding protein